MLSKKIIQLGFTKSGSCLAVNSCGTWDLELVPLCIIFPPKRKKEKKKRNNILPSSKLYYSIWASTYDQNILKDVAFFSHIAKNGGVDFSSMYLNKDTALEGTNYKVLRRV